MEDRIKKYDKGNSLASLERLPDQFQQTLSELRALRFPEEYENINNVVIAGMGGSAYSYYVIKALYGDRLKHPLILSNGYKLPDFVNKNSLVIASSYSGSTEETVSSATDARDRNARLAFVSSGSKLKEMAAQNGLPGYFFDPKHNPSHQPRMGQGYMLLGCIGILNGIGLIRVAEQEITRAIHELRNNTKNISEEAARLSPTLKNKYLIYVAAEHLAGNAHIIRNQTNETAKQFAMYALIPELNHHLMEGLGYPKDHKPHFVFLNSDNYSRRIKKRFELTDEVVRKNGAQTTMIKFNASSRLAEFMTVLGFGGYLTFYLAMEYGLDPAKIPWVDYFKEKLG